MRLLRYAVLGLLASMLTLSVAQADTSAPRNFGTTNCPQKFPCAGIAGIDLVTMANDCAVHGFGISTQQTGIFDGATLDNGNCMMGQTLNSGSGRPMAPQCCII